MAAQEPDRANRSARRAREGRPARAPTIHDVAARCAVAASTVSRAFSHPERVNAATRERILATAAEMGYRPHPLARALPSGQTRMLGLLVPDITNPFFLGLIRGAQRAAAAAGYTIVLADSDECDETELTALDRLTRAVDGFVLASSRLSDARLREADSAVPLVVVNRRVPPVPSVLIDSAPATKRAVEHLASLGHTRFAYLSGPRASWSDARRWRALQSVARRGDLDVVRLGPLPPTVDGGVAAADAVLAEGVTAVVAFNDLLAIGVLRRLRELGVSVPGEVSVLGCDDIFGADFCDPPLTTLAAPIERAGRAAVDLLLRRLDSGPSGGRHRDVVLPATLTVRDSTGPAPVRRRDERRNEPTQVTATS
ncbi:LacI family DNA-binding transcriptional regulator [Thermasporomyces composti]|uniref:LacI family transcriptional regulator n=1 Tax=Thermasporomyces composti TaxID=696763 RepID=A0A3D9VID1_THECX|nr:LacI family DNA-binding transcriptional regulator [Thermasporomyces composti]REF37974.1 LacI family transcriptional regulator [Thermasporomyces composti]